MTLDARALVAMALKEPSFDEIAAALADDDNPRVSATALAEAGIILFAKTGSLAELKLDILVSRLHLTVVPFTADHWRGAIRTYEDAVKAKRGAPPRLGECLSAAVAGRLGSPLIRR